MFYMKYSYIRQRQIYLALAVKNIQSSLIFLARFFVYSQMLSAGEVSSVCQAMVE